MKILSSALLLTGSNNQPIHSTGRGVHSRWSGGSEKEKAAQIGGSVAAFSSSNYNNQYTSKGDNLQRIIRTHGGGANHVKS